MSTQATPRLSPATSLGTDVLAQPRRHGSFLQESSIVLIGIRGVGKSSLAVIAAKALGFRLVDADQHFQQATGLSRPAFKSAHGAREYTEQEVKVLRSILANNPSRTIITCGPSSIAGLGRDVLRAHSATHPVIFLLRDTQDIHLYIRVWEADAISDLVSRTTPLCRAASSFEFYNLSESYLDVPGTPTESRAQCPSSLTLKQVEQDFLQLIRSIKKKPNDHDDRATRYAPTLLPPESKPYTYALVLRLSDWAAVGHQFRGVDLMADVVEVVVDLPAIMDRNNILVDTAMKSIISRHFYSVRRTLRMPIVFSADTASLASPATSEIETPVADDVYFEILQHALRFAPDYLCVDISRDPQRIQRLVSRKGSTKIIGHFHDPSPGPDGWENSNRLERIAQAEALGCQVVRLTQDAASMMDNFSIQRFVHKVQRSNAKCIPLIAYNTGMLGRFSCCLNSTLTPVTHSLLRSLPVTTFERDWLLTVQDCQRALYASFASDELFFGIYGSKVSASLSPAMHNAAYDLYGMPHEYKIFQHTSLAHLDELLKDPSFGGASITSPFKMEVLDRIQFLSPSASTIRAVNTLVPLRSNKLNSLLHRNRRGPALALYGDNTDWIGIFTCIGKNLSPINAVGRDTTSLILGAGGMARAAAYAMIQLGVRNILVYNRSRANAEALVSQFCNQRIMVDGDGPPRMVSVRHGVSAQAAETAETSQTDELCDINILSSLEDQWPPSKTPPTIVVSCIPGHGVGDGPAPNITLPSSWLANTTGGVVVELAYDPLETPLLKQIKSLDGARWIAVDGLQVLPEQGITQFELFTGRKAPQSHMRAVVPQAYMEQVNSGARARQP